LCVKSITAGWILTDILIHNQLFYTIPQFIISDRTYF